jgi:uncharacterized protein YkwD
MLQLINEARVNPPAAAQMVSNNLTPDVQQTLQYYGVNLGTAVQAISSATPLPPVAWNPALAVSAQAHSQDMANTKVQSHTGSDGSSPEQRMQQAGYYNLASNTENAYAYATSAKEAMQAFLIDWGVSSNGHRKNIQQPGVSVQNANRDVGIGIVQTGNSSFGPMVVTQDFASRTNEQAQLVGVAFYDNAGTRFYQPGEGQGGLQIDAVNLQTGQVSSTQTWDAGGYELSLAPGRYRIIASLNNTVFQTTNITVGTVNVEQDFILSDSWQGGSRQSAITAAQPSSNPQPVAPPPSPSVSVPVVKVPVASPPVVSVPGVSAPVSSSAAPPSFFATWSAWTANIGG